MLTFTLNHQQNVTPQELSLPTREHIIGIFGQSGAGKSSLLKGIAGLQSDYVEQASYNDVSLAQQPYSDLPIYYLDQQALLFPHLTVKKNLQLVENFGKFAKQSPIAISDVIEWCQLALLLEKKPEQLSGGQLQRAAFAQSLLSGKPLILLDEPFSALDWQAREHFCQLLQYLHRNYQRQFIIVSHSLKELALCTNQIIHLEQFNVVKQGNNADMIAQLSKQQGQYRMSVLKGELIEILAPFNLAKVRLKNKNGQDDGQIIFVAKPSYHTQQFNVEIDANKVSLSKAEPTQSTIVNSLSATILAIEVQTHCVTIELDVDGQLLQANISLLSTHLMGFKIGEKVYAQFKVI